MRQQPLSVGGVEWIIRASLFNKRGVYLHSQARGFHSQHRGSLFFILCKEGPGPACFSWFSQSMNADSPRGDVYSQHPSVLTFPSDEISKASTKLDAAKYFFVVFSSQSRKSDALMLLPPTEDHWPRTSRTNKSQIISPSRCTDSIKLVRFRPFLNIPG